MESNETSYLINYSGLVVFVLQMTFSMRNWRKWYKLCNELFWDDDKFQYFGCEEFRLTRSVTLYSLLIKMIEYPEFKKFRDMF